MILNDSLLLLVKMYQNLSMVGNLRKKLHRKSVYMMKDQQQYSANLLPEIIGWIMLYKKQI